MPRGCERGRIMQRRNAIVTIAAGALWTSARGQNSSEPGAAPLYLTFDTGHMGIAALVAEVLRRQQVRASFFAANERTQEGEGSLSRHWGPWWKARAAEGHELASHTWDHVDWRADLPGREPRFRVRPSAGAFAGREFTWSAEQYCQNIEQASERLAYYSGKKPLPLFRAPGGKTSPRLLAAARACGYAHVGWSPAGFLGDELPSDKYPNRVLLERALKTIRPGDILLAHLGIWSRQDPWAPAVLEPLIEGLKARGFVFRTLRQHPQYAPWIAQQRA